MIHTLFRHITRLSLAGFAFALPFAAHAYFSTIDTGELIAPEKYQAILEPQLILNKHDGFNMIGRFDTGLTEDSSVRGVLGVGKVDFQLGGFFKWVPFPDVGKQPAIGLETGALLARVNSQSEFSVRLHPLVSKAFQTEVGDLVPYGSLPLGVTFRSDKTFVPVQIVGGSEMRPLNWPRVSFFAELGLNLTESFSYISGAIAYRFDDTSLRKRK